MPSLATWANPPRCLGIDYGLERTGLAINEGLTVLPLATLSLAACRTRKNLLDQVSLIARERACEALVMGLPLLLDNTETATSVIVRNAARRISRRLPDLPIYFMPEFLSSHEAESKLACAGIKGAKAKRVLDQVAACRILESFLADNSFLKPASWDPPPGLT